MVNKTGRVVIRILTHEFQACCLQSSAIPTSSHVILQSWKQKAANFLIFAHLIKRNSNKYWVSEGFDYFHNKSSFSMAKYICLDLFSYFEIGVQSQL